jgi:DNA end-binding protein Ku
VETSQIVKGVDLGGGEYVIMSDDELAAAAPEKSKLIEITDFVDLEKIDPVFFRTTYYLAPEGEGAEKAYSLLRQVMRNTSKVAIGTLVMRNKEYPVAIRPDDEVLKLETMYFADEIRSPTKELPELPSDVELGEREIAMAQVLLESMESDWNPDAYRDTHREKVEALVEEKRQGREIVTGTAPAPAATKVADLMEVLSASINSVKVNRDASKPPAPLKKPAAKRTVSAKSAKPATPIRKAAKSAPKKAPARRKAS